VGTARSDASGRVRPAPGAAIGAQAVYGIGRSSPDLPRTVS